MKDLGLRSRKSFYSFSISSREREQLEIKNLLPEYQKHMYAQYLPDFKALIEIG